MRARARNLYVTSSAAAIVDSLAVHLENSLFSTHTRKRVHAIRKNMRVLSALLTTLPLLVTAVPAIIPIAVDQNLQPSTMDISPTSLDSGSPSDSFSSEPFSLDSLPGSPEDGPSLSSPNAAPGAKACGRPENSPCGEGQICIRLPQHSRTCVDSNSCAPRAGICRTKAAPHGALGPGKEKIGAIAAWGIANVQAQARAGQAQAQDWYKLAGGDKKFDKKPKSLIS